MRMHASAHTHTLAMHACTCAHARALNFAWLAQGFNLRNLKYLVMDEADRLLNMDFEVAINKILEVIPR
jgi:ATP-dependent RNA helicase DDX47/RRP3